MPTWSCFWVLHNNWEHLLLVFTCTAGTMGMEARRFLRTSAEGGTKSVSSRKSPPSLRVSSLSQLGLVATQGHHGNSFYWMQRVKTQLNPLNAMQINGLTWLVTKNCQKQRHLSPETYQCQWGVLIWQVFAWCSGFSTHHYTHVIKTACPGTCLCVMGMQRSTLT